MIISYLLIYIGFIIYSYSQIDLNLTLSANSYYQGWQQQLIQLGYFNRQLSASIFLFLLIGLFSLYFLALIKAKKNGWSLTQVWWLIAVTSILILSYPAFSHDIFNYMFDARIVTRYGLDPAYFKALDFPFDQWTRFMRWTHRYYPYGPVWLWLTLVPSWLGMGKFVVTLFLFKLMFLVFHFANCVLVQKIAGKIYPQRVQEALVFFALNPLVIIESVVSPHNEVMMTTVTLLGIWWLVSDKRVLALWAFAIGAGVKFLSGALLPLLWIKTDIKRLLQFAFWVWLVVLVLLVLLREPYSWYLVPLVALAAITDNRWIKLLSIAFAGGALLRYAPFLWLGEYSQTTIQLEWSALAVGFTVLGLLTLWKKEALF